MTSAAGTSVWRPESRPRLPSKVRVQWNAPRGQALLLYPEGALTLNPTAQAVLELCDGRRTVGEIARELAGRFDGSEGADDGSGHEPITTAARHERATAAPERERAIELDVIAFLERLRQRGWIADASELGPRSGTVTP